jgi:ATP-dependent Lon protease
VPGTAKELDTMGETYQLPVLPMRDAVLFPGVVAPVNAGRPGTLAAVDAAMSGRERAVLVLTQHEDTEEVDPNRLHSIGTVAHIAQVQRGPNGMQLILHGERRASALRIEEANGHLVATVRDVADLPPVDATAPGFVALHREARRLAGELGEKAGLPKQAVAQFLSDVEEPGRFADLVAAYVDITTSERQALLETADVEDRLERVLRHMSRQIAVLDAQAELKSKVQEELGDRQKEMYLRQQLKAIQKELGEGGERDAVAELREKLAALALPAAARKEVDRELGRLERMGAEAMEAQVIRTYLETIAELPWSARSDEHLDVERAATILAEDHHALGEVKDRVLEFLAVRQLHEKAGVPRDPVPAGENADRSPILLFVGPPGVGKTSVAQSIARAMGRTYVRVSLGGVRDEADIRGHRRTYVGAMPGRIIQGMKQAGVKNPVFLLDELDKLGVSFQGDPAAALLEVLDPAQNDTFTDHYLGVPFDLSEVLFIGTANFIQNIPAPLLDRMEVVTFAGYTETEKAEIARRFLVPRQRRAAGLSGEQITLTDEGLAELIAGYTRESGVRQLEREIGRVARKVARKIAAAEVTAAVIDREQVGALLGRPRVHPERAARADQVGVATGMFYTPVGGDIMFVEATTMKGKGELVLTGQLGDVMKESARAAWTFARAHAEALHIDPDRFDRDVHVHVPAGAIPKDGPSAGVTMATALVSALAGRPVRHDVAMTGEITLSGRVLPIGGVKEKVLGAVRAGITTIVLPAENLADLEDVPKETRERIEVFAVGELGEVLALTLRDSSYREGRLLFGDQRPEDVVPLSASGLAH